MTVLEVLAFVAGALLVAVTLLSAIRTFVLPRAARVRLSQASFHLVGMVFSLFARPSRPYAERDRIMALYAPVALLAQPLVWSVLFVAGYTGMFWAIGIHPIGRAYLASGAALLTFGFDASPGYVAHTLAFTEGMLGIAMIGLLIAYLPSIYGGFSRREADVALLDTYAGSPPSPSAMLALQHYQRDLSQLDDQWARWQRWFAEIEESHTSIAAICFLRSPQPERSWITAAGCVLDAASLTASAIDMPRTRQAEVTIRTGFLALRRIADYFQIPYDPDPKPQDPISISRSEFDEVLSRLAAAGLPIVSDRDAAWISFAGWRVNYDRPLLALAGMFMAPRSLWTGDRADPYRRPHSRQLRPRRGARPRLT
jgi:hypothetical protein